MKPFIMYRYETNKIYLLRLMGLLTRNIFSCSVILCSIFLPNDPLMWIFVESHIRGLNIILKLYEN